VKGQTTGQACLLRFSGKRLGLVAGFVHRPDLLCLARSLPLHLRSAPHCAIIAENCLHQQLQTIPCNLKPPVDENFLASITVHWPVSVTF
jgi:hypothetical protein